MSLSLAVSGLRPTASPGGVALDGAGGAPVLRYRGLVATDALGQRLHAWWSVRSGSIDIRVADRGARYPLRIDPFVQQGSKLVGTGAVGKAEQGYGVALSADGNTALVGGRVDNNQIGAAWVFTRSGSTWSQQAKLVGTGAVGQAQAGTSVALSGDGNTAVIGGPEDNNWMGAAWVFTRSGSTWSQQGSKLIGTGAVGPDPAEQGTSVALSGDGNTVLIGGPRDDGSAGAAWVFTRSGSTWSQQGSKLVGTGAVTPAQQGFSVALSGDGSTALIGGPRDNLFNDGSVGAAWVFTRSGSSWSQQKKLVGTGATGFYGSHQGSSVALSGDGSTALIGGPNDNALAGAGWVFTRSGSTWAQQGSKLVGTGAATEAEQGSGVSLSGDGNTALVGGPGAFDQGQVGAAWVFTRSGSTWSQQGSKLVGSGAVGQANQGFSVALSGDASTALVGGPLDNNDLGAVGAVWVFAVLPPPTISSFAPGSGITGSEVTITGTNLWAATGVRFGSLAASFMIVSATQLDATLPNGAVAAPISVTTPAGTATSAESFTPTVSITSLSPGSGPFGTVVTIRGIGFTSGSAVKFNGTASPTVHYVNSGEVTATVPSTATTGPVTLTNASAPAGTVRSAGSYTVTPHVAPTISSFTPGSGITGSKVTITGTYLSGASRITFGAVAASNFAVYSPTQIGARVPDGAIAGPITVTTAAGTATSSTNFAPTLSITGFSPSSGPAGAVVDIHGVGFTPTSTVKFDGTAATAVTFVSASEVQATVPSGATTGHVSLTNTSSPTGTVSSARSFTVT